MSSTNRACRILVADDDETVRVTVVDILRSEGWEVGEARDGIEALEKAISERPGVLLLDHRMPGLLGSEVVQELRRREIGLPVVLVTAAHAVEEIARSLGLEHFIPKPFELDQLLDTLDLAAASNPDCRA